MTFSGNLSYSYAYPIPLDEAYPIPFDDDDVLFFEDLTPTETENEKVGNNSGKNSSGEAYTETLQPKDGYIETYVLAKPPVDCRPQPG